MKVKFVRNTMYNGEVCSKGRVVEMTELEAGWYLNTGKVVAHHEDAELEDRAVGVGPSEKPKLVKRRPYKRGTHNGG